ncbi:aldehyde ferredoxin oxidoreductase family protein [Desulfovibrio litoralis]|uniref:Aldehyde:ferredoxin oxidoreductase n=1 Tax=Desulfovibrio litoralis DSM 11393 TaxID=1121455 RepID=A0A1M7T3N6_9BACT|nr:aldehyde ferredoxin oxidoreductase C-terminal domain-containing protein [Desulfovibrio litoralis]SHN65264.1 aldehyde:ferredoxin oxidoreductase [Desulfovibrio litoralis DSM 11393]
MDKVLRINVGADGGPKAKTEGLGEYAGLGGRAMTSLVVCKEVPPLCHPLGPENKLVIAPGIMSGSAAPTSGRVSIGCKSPLTGTIKEANSGGSGAQALSRLGYAAVILEGARKNSDLYRIVINSKEVRIEKCNDWRGLTNYDLNYRIRDEFGTKVSVFSIGTAGEMLMCNSTIAVTDPECRPSRHAGRGGVGAVMGSKGIKCIIIEYEDTKMREPKDATKFKDANKRFAEGLLKHGVTGQGLPAYGTNVLVNILNEAGGLPTKNFSTGRFADADKISGETMAATITKRGGNPTHGCHRGCIIKCSGIYVDKDGKYISKQPEYETVWAHGANCGISDLDAIAEMDYWDDNYGLDTIEMGATIAVAMDAGVIQFGDAKGALNLIHETGKGTHLGRILGAGTAVTAKCFGLERAPVVKGQAMPAYDPRAVKGQGVTYATTTMGADHTAGYAVTANILGVGGTVDPLKPAGQVELSRNLQIATAALDSTGWCLFIAFAILDQPETFQAMVDSLNAMTGLSLTADDVNELGKKILRAEKDFNEKAGFGPQQDRLPMYFSREALAPHGVKFDVSDADLDAVYKF